MSGSVPALGIRTVAHQHGYHLLDYPPDSVLPSLQYVEATNASTRSARAGPGAHAGYIIWHALLPVCTHSGHRIRGADAVCATIIVQSCRPDMSGFRPFSALIQGISAALVTSAGSRGV
jgi:hypothetical protein